MQRLTCSFVGRLPRLTTRLPNHQTIALPILRTYSSQPHPTKDQIEARVMQIMKDFDKVDPSKLTPTSHFTKDLGLDSLDQVEITMAIEEEFHIEIPDKDAEEILTVEKAVEKVWSDKNAI